MVRIDDRAVANRTEGLSGIDSTPPAAPYFGTVFVRQGRVGLRPTLTTTGMGRRAGLLRRLTGRPARPSQSIIFAFLCFSGLQWPAETPRSAVLQAFHVLRPALIEAQVASFNQTPCHRGHHDLGCPSHGHDPRGCGGSSNVVRQNLDLASVDADG